MEEQSLLALKVQGKDPDNQFLKGRTASCPLRKIVNKVAA
jgi:hypothetical protein